MPTQTVPESQMSLVGSEHQPLMDEFELLLQLLPLADAHLLELGCGDAAKTRQIAEQSDAATIVAAEVDLAQHHKNLQVTDLPKVAFKAFGAEAIEAEDDSFDIVLMFKSLHHVPIDHMPAALEEIHRVLKPGGLAYISEPVFAGGFNDIIRLFHDEERVRLAAFHATESAIAARLFQLKTEVHFNSAFTLRSFSQFEANVLNVTHTDHQPTAELLAKVKERFELHRDEQSYPFEVPHRVDLLEKPRAQPQ